MFLPATRAQVLAGAALQTATIWLAGQKDMSSLNLPTYVVLHPRYVTYLTGKEGFSKGEAPMQSIISLMTKTLAVFVTYEMNIN